MKKSVILIFGVFMSLTQVFAQSTEVPVLVKTAFAKKFPDVKKAKWDKENNTEWEAEFKMNGKEYSANFNNEGTWMETEYEIGKDAIPAAVKKTLDNDFNGYDVEEIEVSETTKGKVYEFELEKGEINMEVSISPEGKIIKKEIKKEGDDEGNEDKD